MRRLGDRIHQWGMNRRRRCFVSLALVVSILVILPFAGQVAYAELLDVSGRYSLATIVMPVPASLIGIIQVNTPAEMTLLKFGIESEIDFTATIWDAKFHLNSAINIAGLERVIVDGYIDLGLFDMKLEVWNAVPFETVTDVSHFANSVVIPPGDLMYVKTRFETSGDFPGFSFHNLMMIEDVNFPNPYADFIPLTYTAVQSQSFHVGDILTQHQR